MSTICPENAEQLNPTDRADQPEEVGAAQLAADVESLLRRVASLETRLEALARAYRSLPTEVREGYGRVGYRECHQMDRVHP